MIFIIELKFDSKSKSYICKNKIKNKKIKLYKILKYINKIIIRLKTIKYKKDSFCYLFFYQNLDS